MDNFSTKIDFQYNLSAYVGLKGLTGQNRRFAKNVWAIFCFGMIFIAFLLLMSWQRHLFGPITSTEHVVISFIVWGYLLIGSVIMCLLVKHPFQFLKQNWLLPVCLFLGWIYIPLLHYDTFHWLRNLQPLLAFCLLTPSIGLLIYCFIDGKLSTTLYASLFVIVLFGFLIAGVDPKVKNVWDGIWWAIATVSTVGYGDVVPVTFLGRILGTILIILGLGIFVTITANYLELLMVRERESAKKQGRIKPTDAAQGDIIAQMETMTKTMKQLSKQIKNLEDKVNK